MPTNNQQPTAEETGRLQATFQDRPLSSHGAGWDSLWTSSFTPWDRGGPSAALDDLLTDRRGDLFAAAAAGGRKRALVPGCGRGYDALLLAAHGYDVCGLDYSATATREAIETERKAEAEGGVKASGGGEEKGVVTWVTGDFFADEFLDKAGTRTFDLIFDYTFLCALPPSARPKWAKRMSQLLTPSSGRLVCLEWPLHKDASAGGPPWGLTPEVYEAHLSRPGEDVPYGEDGRVVVKEDPVVVEEGALRRLERVRPRRTHRAGYDGEGNVIDFISVWGH